MNKEFKCNGMKLNGDKCKAFYPCGYGEGSKSREWKKRFPNNIGYKYFCHHHSGNKKQKLIIICRCGDESNIMVGEKCCKCL